MPFKGVVRPEAAGDGATLSTVTLGGLNDDGTGGRDDFVARGIGTRVVCGLATRPLTEARFRRLPSATLLRPNQPQVLVPLVRDDGPAVWPWTSRSSTRHGAWSLRSSWSLRLKSEGESELIELAVMLEKVDVARRMREVKPPVA